MILRAGESWVRPVFFFVSKPPTLKCTKLQKKENN